MEPKIDPEFLQHLIPSTVSLIVTGVATLLIGIYFEKFRNRLVFVKYEVQYQPLATSSETEYWGRIDVYHNGTLKQHLNFITIKIENDSNRDLHPNGHLQVKPWGQKEFAILDPDNNLLTFGQGV